MTLPHRPHRTTAPEQLQTALALLPHGPEFRFLDRLLSLVPARLNKALERIGPQVLPQSRLGQGSSRSAHTAAQAGALDAPTPRPGAGRLG